MDPISGLGLVPIGDSPTSSERSNRSPRRAGSFSFRNLGRKSPSPDLIGQSSFPFDNTDIEKEKFSRKSSSPLKSPGRRSFRIKNVNKEKTKEILGQMESESGR